MIKLKFLNLNIFYKKQKKEINLNNEDIKPL